MLTTECPPEFNYICVTGINSEKQDIGGLPVTFTPSDLWHQTVREEPFQALAIHLYS